MSAENELKYDSLKVAALIAKTCNELGFHYNNTKIQKLLYCCYGCALVILGQRLCDEYPRAWQFGPVFPRVFRYINRGRNLLDVNLECSFPENVTALIKMVVETLGRYTAKSLSDWTHKEGSPWEVAVKMVDGDLGGFIPDDLIFEYFKNNVVSQPQNDC